MSQILVLTGILIGLLCFSVFAEKKSAGDSVILVGPKQKAGIKAVVVGSTLSRDKALGVPVRNFGLYQSTSVSPATHDRLIDELVPSTKETLARCKNK